MKKLIFALIFLSLPASAYASSASSTVINNVNASSTNSNSQVTSHTDITVETNGQTTHYTSDEPNKSVHVESNNGTSNIEVNGQSVSGNEGATTVTPRPTDSNPTATPTPMVNEVKRISLIQRFIDRLERPFKILFSLLHHSSTK